MEARVVLLKEPWPIGIERPHRLDEAVSKDVAVTCRVEVAGIEFGMPESLSADAAPERHLPFELRLSMHVLRSARCTNGALHVDAAGMPQVEVRLVAEEDMRPPVLRFVFVLVRKGEAARDVELGQLVFLALNMTEQTDGIELATDGSCREDQVQCALDVLGRGRGMLLRVDSGDERPSVLNTLTVSVED